MADPMFSYKRNQGGMSADQYDPDGDGLVSPESHTHPISDVTDLSTQLASKADAAHTHSEYAKEVSDVAPTAGGATLATVEAKLNELIASLKV